MADTSYPMMTLAREFDLDYGLVLRCAEEVRREDTEDNPHNLGLAHEALPAEFVYDMFLSGLKRGLKKYGTQHARY